MSHQNEQATVDLGTSAYKQGCCDGDKITVFFFRKPEIRGSGFVQIHVGHCLPDFKYL